jgi:glycosyltransferase involved in cell wall biosynthesis
VQELERLLESIRASTRAATQTWQIIIVDQNPDDRLKPLAQRFSDLPIEWVRTQAQGQSHAKNVGLELAHGKYITFPDDDCYFPAGTLSHSVAWLESRGGAWGLFGVGFDPLKGRELLTYPKGALDIRNPRDSKVFLGLQIAQFYRTDEIQTLGGFDEAFCSGSKWGSGEETDLAIRFLTRGGALHFNPALQVFHPYVVPQTMELAKVRRYAEGFGALCRKHSLGGLLLWKVAKQLAGALLALSRFQPSKAQIYWVTAVARLSGYQAYRAE